MRRSSLLLTLFTLLLVSVDLVVAQNSNENSGINFDKEISDYKDKVKNNPLFPESTPLYNPPLLSNPFTINPIGVSSHALMRNHSISLDYSLLDTKKLSKQFSITSFGQQATYLGLGDYTNMGATFRWSPSKSKFSIDAGGFAGKQHGYMLFLQQTIWGTNLNLNYEISPKFRLSLKGQYVNSSNIDPFLFQNNFFLNTNVGLFAEYRPTKNLSLGFGLLYLYEEMKKNRSPQGGIRVTFYF